MKKLLLALAALSIVATTASAQNASIWSHQLGNDAAVDGGWVVTIPALTSDLFSSAYDVTAGVADNDDRQFINGNMNVNGVGISVVDFGSTQTYTQVGVFRPNLGLDATGLTPNLSLPIATSTDVVTTGTPLFTFQFFSAPEGDIPTGDTTAVAAVQFPAGNPGLMGIGCDSTASGTGNNGFTQDGFATPSIIATFLDMGINIGQDNTSTTSCKQADRNPHGRLRCQMLGSAGGGSSVAQGDKLTCTVRSGDTLNLGFFGTAQDAASEKAIKFRLYFAGIGPVPPCSPTTGLGAVLTATPDPDADDRGVFFRLNAQFPSGFAGNTFKFAAVWGNGTSNCLNPGVGFTNCVTLNIAADPPPPQFGACDDGTVESGWVVSIPSGPSDFFNNNFGGAPPSVNSVTDICIAVLDFLTATPQFPQAGISKANLVVDPSGNTPDIFGPGLLCRVVPFTFPPGSFGTTSGSYPCQPCPVPGSLLVGDIHGWMQFQPADPGLLGIGVDTSSVKGCSFSSSDAYRTPAVPFPHGNIGIRLKTN